MLILDLKLIMAGASVLLGPLSESLCVLYPDPPLNTDKQV